ncbi:hypothetical protein E3T25_08920 [Cryobacterium sandaracinum]|uniref:Uncharacterized protein n=1 Tax=Cryobacterium sandaracinum TaxID=1259247 RepID=A0ABY2JBT4_9MICO|nr:MULTISPECIES: hypothetical protein [Cryobacterium]TFC65939.1 hypothetical protein E3O54_11660 [Cryobacterium sp. TMT2-4]TFD02430.1 hypothetical protein E3T25_08920 [Cryobacterium sandaracinum]
MTPQENSTASTEALAGSTTDAVAPTVAAAPSTPAPLPTSPPAFSPREVRVGAVGLAIGLVVGVVGSLLMASVAGGLGSIALGNPMADAAATCEVETNPWITVGDEGRSISMQSEGEEAAGANFDDLACVLLELDTPDSVINRIDSTRALDGRQTGTWEDYSASWGYHPDNGLDIVIEMPAY